MTDFAVIQCGGRQYIVKEGQRLVVPKLADKKGSWEVIDLLSGRKVRARLIENRKETKFVVRKFRAKSRYLRRKGHRNFTSLISIEKIGR